VNIFPAIPAQIPIRSAVFSAIAPCTAWEKTVVAISGIRRKELKIAPRVFGPTAGKTMNRSVPE